MKPGQSGMARLFDAAGYSIKGIRAAWRDEAAFRQEVALSAVLFPLSFLVARSIEQWLLLTTPLFLLLIVELLNSAIENAVDRIGHKLHDLSGQTKDMGSAAVLVCLLMLADGLFTRFPRPDFALAIHDNADLPAGQVSYTPGFALADQADQSLAWHLLQCARAYGPNTVAGRP